MMQEQNDVGDIGGLGLLFVSPGFPSSHPPHSCLASSGMAKPLIYGVPTCFDCPLVRTNPSPQVYSTRTQGSTSPSRCTCAMAAHPSSDSRHSHGFG